MLCLGAAHRALIASELIRIGKRHVMIDLPPAALLGDEAKDTHGAYLGEFGQGILLAVGLAVVRVGALLPPGEDDQLRRDVGDDVVENGLYSYRSREHAPSECSDGGAAADDPPDRAVDLDEGIVRPDLLIE